MSTFNFAYHNCCLCGNLTDDGGFCCKKWFCLDCLDLIEDLLHQEESLYYDDLPF